MRSIAILLLLCATAAAHPRHTSLADAELDDRSGALQVVLRVAAADLTEAVGAKVSLEQAEPAIEAWLRRGLRLADARGAPIRWRWVGVDIVGLAVDLYFEAPVAKLRGLRFENRLFFEQASQQINQLNISGPGYKGTLLFTAQSPTATVE